MSFIRKRLRRLEGRGDPERCPECRYKRQKNLVFYPDEGDHRPQTDRCSRCGRPLEFVIAVVYQGEGG